MPSPQPATEIVDSRTYFAAERTLLAWIRTGLAMMGFGFVVSRFGLFLREIAAVHSVPPLPQHGVSLWAGVTLVMLGVAVNIMASLRHWKIIRRFQAGQAVDFHPLSMGTLLGFTMGILGLVVAIYLVFGVNHSLSDPAHPDHRTAPAARQ